MSYLYVLSSEDYLKDKLIKLGCTEDPHARLQTYRTSYPPGKSREPRFYKLWKINAVDRDEMFQHEGELHDKFVYARLSWTKAGDSEWFELEESDIYTKIDSFVKNQVWFIEEKSLDEVAHLERPTHLSLNYHHNWKNNIPQKVRDQLLSEWQKPHIDQITSFFSDPKREAATFYAPCGIGKTIMTCEALRRIRPKRVIIAVPSLILADQWKKVLISQKVFTEKVIGKSCIITTNKSSSKQIENLTDETVIIFDEAHHMAGLVSSEGEGMTRAFLDASFKKNVKRFFLTYTPRFIRCEDDKVSYASMDQPEKFGTCLGDIKLRPLINQGLLPDYRIWTLRSFKDVNRSPENDAEHLLEAWRAEEIVGEVSKPILHHLVVFVRTHEDGYALKKALLERDAQLHLIYLDENVNPDTRRKLVKEFRDASRSIIINCKMLGEGVDIPEANGVCIMYPKQSQGEIVQMLLRAGRFLEGKTVFHMLFPIFTSDDNRGFQHALCALGSVDEQLRDEIIIRANSMMKDSEGGCGNQIPQANELATQILIETVSSDDLETIREIFTGAKLTLLRLEHQESPTTYEMVRKINRELGLKSIDEYERSSSNHRCYIPEPRITFKERWVSDYHFLGMNIELFPATKEEFVARCKERNLVLLEDYKKKVKMVNDLPPDPWQMYEGLASWKDLFGIEYELW
ncbi:MAG: helicase-related protein [Nitrososphaerales archaeon]